MFANLSETKGTKLANILSETESNNFCEAMGY